MTRYATYVAVLLAACWALLGLVTSSTARAEVGGAEPGGKLAVDLALAMYTGPRHLSGKLSIAGSDTMSPLMSKLAAQFRNLHPDVQIAVETVGSNAAIREFQLGLSYQRRGDKVRGKGTGGANRVELLASSRPLTEAELQGFESNHGYKPTGVPIAQDAVAIYVHKDNPIAQLTLNQVGALFGQARAGSHPPISNWGQIGVAGTLATQPIVRYGRDRRSGTRAFFQHVALNDAEYREDILEQPGSASEILSIAQDQAGIGYAGVGFQISLVRMVPISQSIDGPAFLPDRDHVRSGAYPLSRPLYLYVKRHPQEPLDPMVQAFLLFIHSRQGQETVGRVNLYPLDHEQVTTNLRTLGLAPATASEPDDAFREARESSADSTETR